MCQEKSFTDAVQQGMIKQPTQIGFSSEAWIECFNSRISRSSEERHVFEAGLWFFERFEAVRGKLLQFPDPVSDIDKIRCMYVGIVNRDYTEAKNAFEDELVSTEDKDITTGEIIEKRLPIGPDGYPVHVIGTIECEVSAIRYPLSETFRARAQSTSNPHQEPSDLQTLHNLAARLNLSVLYDALSDSWQECLWNGWSVVVDSEKDSVVPPSSDEYVSRVIGQHRTEALRLELTLRSAMHWRELPPHVKQRELRRLRVTRVKRTKAECELELGYSEDSTYPPPTLILALAAEELYWNEILLQGLPRTANVTIREILAAWDVLATLGAVLEEEIPKDTEVKTVEKLMHFAPTFPIAGLIQAVRKATGLSQSKASSIVNLFVFDGNVRTDLWFKPLIPLSEGRCTLLIPAVTAPNLIRSIESWMREGGIDLTKRGEAFEKHFRERVRNALAESTHMSNSLMSATSLVINVDGETEEIDFLWVIGSKVIVGEVKCVVYPASPIEFFKYFEVLKGATIQARRKSDFVSANIEKSLQLLNMQPSADYSGFVIQPLVITNLPLGAGIPLNGIPICDERILMRYIEGKQEFFISTSADGDSKPLFQEEYYSSEEEAESNIISYLLKPPLFSVLRRMLAAEEFPLLCLEKEGKLITVIRLYVNEPSANKWSSHQHPGNETVQRTQNYQPPSLS